MLRDQALHTDVSLLLLLGGSSGDEHWGSSNGVPCPSSQRLVAFIPIADECMAGQPTRVRCSFI